MRVLVFGSTGQVAGALARAQWPEDTTLTYLDRQMADLSRPERLGPIVRNHAPDVVIIAAAYTNVDAAESEEDLAMAVNAAAPAAIAREAATLSMPVVHFSTDYVFDGEKGEYYEETDPVGPLNSYGRSKLAGEIAVRAANPQHLILRTSWVYSALGNSFLRSMLRQAASREEVGIVVDQRGCPTAANDIAQAIAGTLPSLVNADGAWGTYHLAGGSETTWHGFAEAIFEGLAARGIPRPRNRPVPTADYATPARRPKNSRLSSELFAQTFGVRLPGYAAALPAILEEALGAASSSGRAAP